MPQIDGAKNAGLMKETEIEIVTEKGIETETVIMRGGTEVTETVIEKEIETEKETETVIEIVTEIVEEMTAETEEIVAQEGTVMKIQMTEDQNEKRMDIHQEIWIWTARKWRILPVGMLTSARWFF